MKIKMKIKFLVGLFCFVQLSLCIAEGVFQNTGIQPNLILDVDNNLVAEVVDKISCEELSAAIICDTFALYQKFHYFIDQPVSQILADATADDLIREYKKNLVAFYDFQSSDLMSIEWKEKLAYYFFVSMDRCLSPEGSKPLMKDQNFQNALMLIELLGIEFTAKQYLLDIIAYVHNQCEILKNNDLNDISYEMTINAIYKDLAKKFIATGFTQNACNMIFNFLLHLIERKLELKKKETPVRSDQELKNKPSKKKKNK